MGVKKKEKQIVKFLFVVMIMIGNPLFLFSQSYEEGLRAYRSGKDGLALTIFEQLEKQGKTDESVYLYLGIVSQKQGLFEKAKEAYQKGIAFNGLKYYELLFNLGNLFVTIGESEKGLEQYNLVLKFPNNFSQYALLNRANLYVNTALYQKAVADYLQYLGEYPSDPQGDNIEKMINLLQGKILEDEKIKAEEEARQAAAEEAARQQAEREKQRQEEEAARLAQEEQDRLAKEAADKKAAEEEAARQQAMLDEILNSLSSAGDETQNFNAENETLKETFEESGLDD